jgi:uroporphyrinogen decarboxylase
VPVAEVWVDPEVKDAFLGRPLATLQDEVEFWVQAGFDFIAVDTDLYAAPAIQDRIVRPLENTAHVYREARHDRGWVGSASAVIRDRDDLDRFAWPRAEDIDQSVYDGLPALLPPSMKAIVTIGHVFTGAWQLMGFEAFCMALVDDRGLVLEVVERLGRETLRLLDRVLDHDVVGAICLQDDIAYTNGLMISLPMLRQVFFPWLTTAVQHCHAAGRPVILHSDGDVLQAIPELVACGIDALHPIEPKCMAIAAVKRAHGHQLALIGNLDLGYTLTRGTPAEVRQAVLELMRDVAPGGGFLLGSANSITNYVPLHNFRAMLAAAAEFGRYPISIA